MKFRSAKNGYDCGEVDEYIRRVREVYDETLIAQRDRIFALKDELVKAEAKVADYEKNSDRIERSIESAISKADEIEKLTHKKIANELASLRAFHEKWVEYYAKILKKYPLDDELSKVGKIDKAVTDLLDEFDSEPRNLSSESFDPVGMVKKHLASESVDDKFDYDEALHPTENLGDLLKGLGVCFDGDDK